MNSPLSYSHCSHGIHAVGHSTVAVDLTVLGIWLIISTIVYFLFKRFVREKAINRARFFVGYLVLSFLIVLLLIGKHLVPSDLYSNILSEVIGITLTVLIIDRIYHYLSERNEKLHRDISLRHCKTPIYSYCYMWFVIYEPIKATRLTRLQVQTEMM